MVTVSNQGDGKAPKSWTQNVHFEAGEQRTVTIEAPEIFKKGNTVIKVRSRVDEVYYDFQEDEWGRL